MRADESPKPRELEDPLIEEQPTHSQDGVDLTLIRWMLSLTAAERLQVLQENVCSAD